MIGPAKERARAPTENFAFVIWDGGIGGAERLSVTLAAELRRRGITTHVVVIGEAGQLRRQLRREGVPFTALGLRPGSKILRHPRRFAAAVSAGGTTVAVLDAFGYQGAALRLGGFQGRTIGVEHGSLANLHLLPLYRRVVRIADRLIGLRTNDAEVAVSQYMLALARRTFHHRRLVYVPNGIKVPPRLPLPCISSGQLRLGYAGRLARGKGVDVLIRAIGLLHAEGGRAAPVLLIAGDGPERSRLEALAGNLALQGAVRFLGWIDDMQSFWSQCHVAAAPSAECRESFCLSAVEAMAYGRPAIVTNRGALPEVVEDGKSGSVVVGGHPDALAAAIRQYALDPDLVVAQASAARDAAEARFSVEQCADGYLALATSLPCRRRRRAAMRQHRSS